MFYKTRTIGKGKRRIKKKSIVSRAFLLFHFEIGIFYSEAFCYLPRPSLALALFSLDDFLPTMALEIKRWHENVNLPGAAPPILIPQWNEIARYTTYLPHRSILCRSLFRLQPCIRSCYSVHLSMYSKYYAKNMRRNGLIFPFLWNNLWLWTDVYIYIEPHYP